MIGHLATWSPGARPGRSWWPLLVRPGLVTWCGLVRYLVATSRPWARRRQSLFLVTWSPGAAWCGLVRYLVRGLVAVATNGGSVENLSSRAAFFPGCGKPVDYAIFCVRARRDSGIFVIGSDGFVIGSGVLFTSRRRYDE